MAIEALPNAKQYTDFVYSAYQTRHVQINTRIRMADERYQIAKYNQQSDTSFAYRVKRYTVYSKRQDSLKRKSTLVE